MTTKLEPFLEKVARETSSFKIKAISFGGVHGSRSDEMQKAGGVVALIAGVFGVFAAIATLFMGGVAGAFNADGAGLVVGLGWGGLAFSFLTIILGAVCIGSTSRTPGVLLIGSAIAGAILGGTLVAVFMVLALIGGILAVIGAEGGPSRKPEGRIAKAPDAETAGEVLSDADKIIARQLEKYNRSHQAASQEANAPDRAQAGFGKRRAF